MAASNELEAEIFLYSQVTASRKHQVLSILAGYCSMTPVPLTERRVFFEPPRIPRQDAHIGGSQTIAPVKNANATNQASKELIIAQLRRDYDENEELGKSLDLKSVKQGWSMGFYDTPEAQYKSTGLRKVMTMPLDGSSDCDSVFEFMEGLGYNKASHHLVHGYRFAHGNKNIFMYQTYDLPSANEIDSIIPPIDQLTPSHKGNPIMVHVYIMIDDSSNPRLYTAANDELTQFKSDFEGCINLEVPPRLSMDTRVK